MQRFLSLWQEELERMELQEWWSRQNLGDRVQNGSIEDEDQDDWHCRRLLCYYPREQEEAGLKYLCCSATGTLLYRDVTGRIPVRLFTDSESTLESVASSQQIVTKTLQMRIVDLKERLLRGAVTSYAWLPTEMMWADILTKEKKLPDSLEDILLKTWWIFRMSTSIKWRHLDKRSEWPISKKVRL